MRRRQRSPSSRCRPLVSSATRTPSGDYWVLGKNACSENFFTDTDGDDGPDEAGYKLNDDYDPNLSGLENINNASIRWIDGYLTVRKFVPLQLTW